MNWHLAAGMVLALSLVGAGSGQADEATVRKELDTCLRRYDALFRQTFALPVTSPEINRLLSQQVAQATQQAIGFPLQVTISHFTYAYTPTAAQITAHLADLPAAQADAMEKQANQLIQGSAVGQVLELVAFDALKEGITYLAARKAQCVLRQETPAAADFSLDGANQQLIPGLQLKETWFRFDRTAKAVTGIQFRFTSGTSLMARIRYADAALPVGGTAPVPVAAEVTQNALTTPQNGVPVPQKVTVQYGKCTFKMAAAATGG